MKIKTTKSRDKVIEDALTYVSLSSGYELKDNLDHDRAYKEFCRLPASYFGGADLGSLYEDIEAITDQNHQRLWFSPECAHLRDEISRVDLGLWQTCYAIYEDNARQIDGATYLFSLRRIRKVPLKEARGAFTLKTGDVVEVAIAQFFNNGMYLVERSYHERRAGVYHLVAAPYEIKPSIPAEEQENLFLHFAKSMALTNYYEWHIDFGFILNDQKREDVATLSIFTDPVGARDAFKLRDIAPGKSRRDALKHFVQTHWRTSRTGRETQVSEHLRGVEEFTFNGLYCKIHPSEYDLKRLAKAKTLHA